MRDPFRDYDKWKTRSPEDEQDELDRQHYRDWELMQEGERDDDEEKS